MGDVFECKFVFNQDDVNKFAEATGDFNPIHIDLNYAKETIFKRTIVHGLLGASIFSRVFGTEFPGDGTIYLKQDLVFLKPMFVEQDYLARLQIIDVVIEKNRALVCTEILNLDNEIIIKGEALIKSPKIF